MRLHHRARHLLRKPPRVIIWKIAHRARNHMRRFGYWSRLQERLDDQLRRVAGTSIRDMFLQPDQLVPVASIDRAVEHVSEEERQRLIADADACLQLQFNFFGWEREYDALPLPWTTDWETGREWENRYYLDIDYSEPTKPSDVKSCWEPSRFHFALRLGQAYRLTGDVRYRQHFFLLLRDWLAQNPFAFSINWTSPLEVSIRGVNLAVAGAFFSDAPDEDLQLLVSSLAAHGAFLFRNVEYTDVRGNHYTGNLLGLLALGALLAPVVPEAERWLRYAERHVPNEIDLQYSIDGVNREKSVPYHRFVTELFLLSAVLMKRRGRPLPLSARQRLRKAVEYTRVYMRPDGCAPIIGDNDNARALPLGSAALADHSHLIGLAALLDDVPGPPSAMQGAGDALWVFGTAPAPGDCATDGGHAFPEGGMYVLRAAGDYLIVDAGDVGLQSGGCHGHHDMLSFEWVSGGVPVVVDPGCPCYTGDVATKNAFRVTAAHNTARVDGVEQGSFNPELIWHLGNEARPLGAAILDDAEGWSFRGAHAGYHRLPEPVTHERTLILLLGQGLDGTDRFDGAGEHKIELFFHLAANITATRDMSGIQLTTAGREWTFSVDDPIVAIDLVDAQVSPGYGVRLPAQTIRLVRQGSLPWAVSYRFKVQ